MPRPLSSSPDPGVAVLARAIAEELAPWLRRRCAQAIKVEPSLVDARLLELTHNQVPEKDASHIAAMAASVGRPDSWAPDALAAAVAVHLADGMLAQTTGPMLVREGQRRAGRKTPVTGAVAVLTGRSRQGVERLMRLVRVDSQAEDRA